MKTKNTGRNILLKALIAITLITILALPVFASFPAHTNYVADEAGVLAENTVRSLRKGNENLYGDYKIVVAVCTVKNTGETPISEYARDLFSDWKMGEGVLLLIVSETNDYYFIQSQGIEHVLSNNHLTLVRDNYLEPSFSEGNIDKGVNMAVSKLSDLIKEGVQKAPSDEDKDADENSDGTTAGAVIVTVLKVLLYTALILIVIFVILFVVALFNDDVAEIMRKYIFQREKKNYNIANTYYDERLYPERNPDSNGRDPQQRRRQGDYYRANAERMRRREPEMNYQRNEYRDDVRERKNTNLYYNADGTVRRPSRQNAPAEDRYYNENPNNRNRNTSNYDETRAFSIPNRNNQRR